VLPEIMQERQGMQFALCATDPPYGVDLAYDGLKDTDENLTQLIKNFFPTLRKSARVVMLTSGTRNVYKYPPADWILAWFTVGSAAVNKWGRRQWEPILVYGNDPQLREGNGSYPDAFLCPPEQPGLGHPCPKPLELWRWMIRRATVKPTDSILEPFLGSGTTLLAAKQLGHPAAGIEQSEKYCELAAKRLEACQRLDFEPVIMNHKLF
jgi:DNA modification methylase